MKDAAQKANLLMKALANENRLLLLCQLVEEKRSVCELASLLDLPQPVVSQQLAVLSRDGFVSGTRTARTVHYELSGEAVKKIIAVLYELYCEPLDEHEERRNER